MNSNQKLILDILKKSIKDEKFKITANEDIDWETVIQEAKYQDLSSLVYYGVDKEDKQLIDESILKQWKKEVFIYNMIQVSHLNEVEDIIKDLKELDIEVVILKGLVLRNYYPRPEFRSMCDGDILVKELDFDKVKQYLIDKGYTLREADNEVHDSFEKKGNLDIELHRKLINNKFTKFDTSKYEKNLWNNIIKVTLKDVETYSLGHEDFIIHMILHMIVHANYRGFGLKQLYDFSAYIKANKEEVNWSIVWNKLCEFKITKFSRVLFATIRDLFDININYDFKLYKISSEEVDLFLETVLFSGEHGSKNEKSDFNILFKYSDEFKDKDSTLKRLIKFMFPTKDALTDRYLYARDHIFLLPIAWIHRFIRGIFNRYGVLGLIKNIRQSIKIRGVRDDFSKKFRI